MEEGRQKCKVSPRVMLLKTQPGLRRLHFLQKTLVISGCDPVEQKGGAGGKSSAEAKQLGMRGLIRESFGEVGLVRKTTYVYFTVK